MELLHELRSLNLQDKLWPSKNPEIMWFYLFFPALVAYLVLLTQYINEKPAIGYLDSYSNEFVKLFPSNTQIEVISMNNSWSEGPLWVEDDSLGYLLYSDTIQNKIFKWEEGKGFFTVGKTIFSQHAGCFRDHTHCSSVYEAGPNGLLRLPPSTSSPNTLDLLICQHGERSISYMRENGTQQVLVSHFNGKKLNSPNDLMLSPDGDLYFTDPKYGLVLNNTTSSLPAEIPISGVYVVRAPFLADAMATGEPTPFARLLVSNMTHPNGLAFSPDFSRLYISNSLRSNTYLMSYDLDDETGLLKNGRVFYNATDLDGLGAMDGLKVDIHGNIFASGPDGLLVLNADGKLIGRLRVGKMISNVAFGADGRLYLTMEDLVARVKVTSKPVRFVRKGK